MTRDGHDLMIPEIGVFEQSADAFVPQTVPAEIRKIPVLHNSAKCIGNNGSGIHRTASAISSGLRSSRAWAQTADLLVVRHQFYRVGATPLGGAEKYPISRRTIRNT